MGGLTVWIGRLPITCDIGGDQISGEMFDSRLATGTMWATMCRKCYNRFGVDVLGTGNGQRYEEQDVNGTMRFVKVEG